MQVTDWWGCLCWPSVQHDLGLSCACHLHMVGCARLSTRRVPPQPCQGNLTDAFPYQSSQTVGKQCCCCCYVPQEPTPRHVAVKEVVLPFSKFPGADTLLGPEMRSTGEVMGIDYDFASSYAKAQIAAGAVKAYSLVACRACPCLSCGHVVNLAQLASHPTSSCTSNLDSYGLLVRMPSLT